MKWVCSNCGNHFESEDRQVRCPSCLRRNGLIPEEDASPRGERRPFPWKTAAWAGAGILLAAVAALALWIAWPRPAPPSSLYGKSGHDFASLRVRILKDTGVDLSASENPFAAGAAVRDLARAWGGGLEAVMKKFQETADAGIVWEPRREFLLPEALAAEVKARGAARASSLEWALLGHALGVALDAPVALGAARFAPGKAAHPWGLGVYAVGVFPDGFDRPAASWTPAAGKLQADQWRRLDGTEVLAAVLAQQALSRVACLQRPLEALLPRDESAPVPAEDAQFASARIQAALRLAPEFPVLRAASVWTHICLGMHRKARQAAGELVSSHEMLRQKAAGETFLHEQDFRRLSGMLALARVLDRDAAVAQDVQNADAEFAPLNVMAAMGMENGPDLLTELDRLPESDHPEIRFLRVEGMMGIQDDAKRRERAPRALADARALVQAYPQARWPLNLLFGALLETGGFEEARQLVPRITRGLPDEAMEREGLLQVIATSESRAQNAASPVSPASGPPSPPASGSPSLPATGAPSSPATGAPSPPVPSP